MRVVSLMYFTSVFFFGCAEEAVQRSSGGTNVDLSSQWSIPSQWIFDGGPGRDGIPSIDNPQFETIDQIGDKVREFELAVAVKVGEDVKIYPYKIMDYHEIVNDEINGEAFAITYCPLTGTSVNWSRKIQGAEAVFGVSGLIFNNNLMPFDRNSNSTFSQMLNEGVRGQFREDSVDVLNSVEMSYGGLRTLYPNARVLSFNTGFSRNYQVYPYGNYRSVSDLLFPQERIDNRFFAKERVLGVTMDGFSKAYRFSSFDGSFGYDTFRDTELVIFKGSGFQNYMKAYNRRFNGQLLDFTTVSGMGDAVAKDQNGTFWNAFGEAVSGPNSGGQLNYPVSYMGYWFAWAGFNQNISIE